jgi:hypothetical protein
MPRKHYEIKSGINASSAQDGRFLSTYGISRRTILQAARGDISATEHLAKLAHDGKLIAENYEAVTNSLDAVIEGTQALTAINEAIITKGNLGVRKIQQSLNNSVTSEQQFGHAITEMELSLNNALSYEDKRHILTGRYQDMRFKAQDAQLITDIEFNVDSLEKQLVLKQLDADRDAKKRVRQHYYGYGNESNTSLVPAKNYGQVGSTSSPIHAMISSVREWLTGK